MELQVNHIKKWSIVLFITVLTAAIIGVFSIGGTPREVVSIHGETFFLHNHGLYRFDTVSVAIQAISQDFVTIFVWGSLMIFAFIKLKQDSELSKLLMIGVFSYSLYAYMSYAFLSHFNELFLLYIWNMSLSLYLLIKTMILLRFDKINQFYDRPIPIKRTITFMIFVAIMLVMMWLSRIIPGLSPNKQPVGLETYHTLIIQAMDLGFIVPLSLFSAYYLYKRKAIGYALTAILLFKGASLFTAVATMAGVQGILDASVNYVEVGIFLILTAIAIYITIIFFKQSLSSNAQEV